MKINPIVYIGVAIILLGVLFAIFKYKGQTQTTSIPNSQLVESTNSSAPQSNVKTFEIVIKGKKLVSGPETIKVTENDNVVIKITSDENEELHLHGYDKSVDLQKDVAAELSFGANLAGRFVYELEKS